MGEIVESALTDYMCISGKYKARVIDVNVLRAAGDAQSPRSMQSVSEAWLGSTTPQKGWREKW